EALLVELEREERGVEHDVAVVGKEEVPPSPIEVLESLDRNARSRLIHQARDGGGEELGLKCLDGFYGVVLGLELFEWPGGKEKLRERDGGGIVEHSLERDANLRSLERSDLAECRLERGGVRVIRSALT